MKQGLSLLVKKGLLGRRGKRKRKETTTEALYEQHLIIEFWLQLTSPLSNQTNPEQHFLCTRIIANTNHFSCSSTTINSHS